MENKKKPAKILVCSGVKSQIISFVDYLESMYAKKGLFDYVFCIGDFFGVDDGTCEKNLEEFKKSGKKVSVPIYTLGPNKKEHVKFFNNMQDNQLAPNIYYLGKDGVFNTSDGLKIGYISGLESENNENDIHTFNYDSISQFKDSCLRSGINSLDLLLTSPWPFDVRNKERIPENQNVKKPSDKSSESQLLSWIDINLIPRYHFASMQGVFYQRSPYKNLNSNTVTRFVGLGDYFGDAQKKEKWLYGFVLSPVDLVPANKINYTVTESPFAPDQSYYIEKFLPASKQFFYNTNTNSRYIREEPTRKKFGTQGMTSMININTDSCWFCLSSKNITKHMIVSIGNQIYIAGTKGPLVKEHLLIASINHYKSFAHLPIETENEINLIKSCINQYFESTGRLAVYFERNILSAHFQLQVVPVSKRMCDRLEHMFKLKFGEYDLKLVDIPSASSLRQITANVAQYFYVELPNGKRLFYNGDVKTTNQRFPLHIARETLASPNLLNVQDRIDWRKCLQTLEDEEIDISLFSTAFSRFNPIKN